MNQHVNLSLDLLEKQKSVAGPRSETRYNCVFCDDEGFHLYVNKSKKVWHCFRCGKSGVLTGEGTRFLDSYDKIVGEKPKEERRKMVRTLPRNENIPSKLDLTNRYQSYLISERGLTIEEIQKNDIRQSLDKTGTYSNTVIFPVHSRTISTPGLQYFVARKLPGEEVFSKYVNAPWPKEGALYRPYWEWDSVHNDKHTVVVCEGPLDAIKIARVAQSAALLGKQATVHQLHSLLSYPFQRIIIMLDPDAQIQALRLKVDLDTMIQNMYQKLHTKVALAGHMLMDPGSSSIKDIEEALYYANLQIGSRSR